MVILKVYSNQIKTVYKSYLLSKATLLVLISGILSIILPFIIAYRSRGFWLKRDIFYEQPNVKFKGEYLFIATTTNNSHPVTCSSFHYYKSRLKFLDECSIIKVREVDRNFDGLIDELMLSLQMALPRQEKLTSMAIVVPIDYRLQTVCPMQMQSVLIYQQHYLPPTIEAVNIHSDLSIYQSSPLTCNKRGINHIYNHSIVDNLGDLNNYDLDNIISKLMQRNVSTHLSNVYTTFKYGNTNLVKLNLSVRYPEHRIYYIPGFWQTIKWAWIQYFSIYIIVSWFLTQINNYIFNNRLVLFYEESPIKKNK